MKNNKFKIILIPIITAVLSLIVLGFSSLYPKTKNSKTYSNFLKDLNNEEISQVSFNSSSKILVTLKDGYTYLTDNPNSENFKENFWDEFYKICEQREYNMDESICVGEREEHKIDRKRN